MIFRPQLARAVIDGRKTMTRRPVKGDTPCRYKAGHDYAVQPGRGKPAIGRIKVLDVRDEPVGRITHADARAEGFRNTAAFKAYWVRLYDARWVERLEVDITEDLGGGRSESELVYRFDVAHAHKPVWVIAFTTTTDTPRFLAPPGQGTVDINGNADYTENPRRAIDDLEVIDTATQERYSKDALAFCIGRQINRQKQVAQDQAIRKGQKRPYPRAA